MKKLAERLRRAAGRVPSLAWPCAAALLLAASCEGIYDYEGDCDPHWRVRFVYERNMEFADAFPGAMGVGSVRLWVFDAETGEKKLEKSEVAGPEGFAADFSIPVEELAPGRYRFVAWCGLDGNDSFSPVDGDPASWDAAATAWGVPEDIPGAEDPLLRRLKPLWYGCAVAEVDDTQGVHYITVELTKDTNEFTFILQHRSRRLDPEDFTVTVTDDNAALRWDNGTAGPLRGYGPWACEAGTVQADGGADESYLRVKVSVPRLLSGAGAEPRLSVVETASGREVFSFGLVEYLLMPGFHHNLRDAHNNPVSIPDQEYLDREDEWQMHFLLDDNLSEKGGWYAFELHILAWVLKIEPPLDLQ